eukprot:GFYU01004326.1.p1 GENE.GFYU01004326.1~~GFYU01004326.1.p1  ORF type:complete len:432 (+),score=104.34 GFYU01004326.1:34-1296(+)
MTLPNLILDKKALYAEFEVSLKHGFLPEEDPATCLSPSTPGWLHEYGVVASKLPALLLVGNHVTRDHIKKLPDVDENQLAVLKDLSDSEKEYLMLVLTMLTQAYVWGGGQCDDVNTTIPSTIAKPMVKLAELLDRKPILSHASLVLRNWKRIDTSRPLAEDNMATIHQFLGSSDEAWFYLDTVELERRGAAAVSNAVDAYIALRGRDYTAAVDSLRRAGDSIAHFTESMHAMRRHCDPYIFYLRVRPYVAGWKNNDLVPNGVVYEGCFNDEPQFIAGGSAAQSSLLQSLDAILSIPHKDQSGAFIHEMREHMPVKHRRFIESLGSLKPTMREMIDVSDHEGPASDGSSGSDEHLPGSLADTYNYCLEQLQVFRSVHIQFVTQYILQQKNKTIVPQGVGTGGTNPVVFLKDVRDAVVAKRF